MNKKLVKVGESLATNATKIKFWSRRNSPELLVATSILAGAGSIILAVKATLKVEPVLEKANNEISTVKLLLNDDNAIANGEYSKEDGRKALTKVYGKTAFELVKLYGPSAACFAVSVGTVLGSHNIMRGRMAGLAAAYTTIDNAFTSYRGRVQEKIGEKSENDIYQNVYKEPRKVTVEDDEGNIKDVTRKVKVPHTDDDSDFSYIFDADNPEWERNGKLNLDYLLLRERFLNDRFRRQGHMFLWDVYKEIGVNPATMTPGKLQASKVLGWIYDPEDDTRDNYISFGLADEKGNLTPEANEIALGRNGYDVFIEFNVDGDILTGADGKKAFMKYTNIIS